jgi:predicted transcriptional regulator
VAGQGDEEAHEASGRRARGELESDVLAALWAANGPLTARDVRGRLYDKGTLARHREGRGYAYEPVRDEASHTAQRMHSLLKGGSDRQAVLARFVSELSEQDEHLLHQVLSGHDDILPDSRRPPGKR